MPELPEVETLRRELERALTGRRFQAVKTFWPKAIAPLSPARFARELKNQKIESVERRAKILFLNLDNGATLAIHLKMTGQLIYLPRGLSFGFIKESPRGLIIGGHPQSNPRKYTRAIFNFTDGSQLFFNDLRKFGWLKLLPPKEKQTLVSKHGVEPLTQKFTLAKFSNLLARYPNRRLKQILLNQTLIAGLGNIYADESCFAAGIRPSRLIKNIQPTERQKLYQAIKNILRLAIKRGGTSTKNYVRSDGSRGGFTPYLKVYGRAGKPCKNCRSPITKIKLSGRGTHFCPECQK